MRGRHWLRLATAMAVLSLASAVSAQAPQERPPLQFLVDPDLSMDPGARTTLSLARLLYRYDEALRGDAAGGEEPNVPSALARAVKVVMIDAPLASTAVTFGHEVFGHGGRAREQGLPTSYRFRLVEPYRTIFGQDDELAGEAMFERQDRVDRDLALVSGGIEADYRTAYWITRDLVRARGRTHYGDMLMYAAARLSYFPSLLSPGDHTEASDDVHGYVGLLQRKYNRWGADERISIENHLRTAYLWNLLDPVLLFSAVATARHVAYGERFAEAPLPRAGDVSFLPWPTFGLSPFGAEHGLVVFLEREGRMLEVEGRLGSSGLSRYGGAGVQASGIRFGELLSMSARVDGWVQPELLFRERNVFERPNRAGGNVATEGTFVLSRSMALMLSMAYKSRGYLPGKPLDRGMYGYMGVSWSAP